MLLFLVDCWQRVWPDLAGVEGLEKITSRAALAALASFTLAIVFGRRWIAWLGGRFREQIKSASPEVAQLHQPKQATPTMGGLFIIAGLLLTTLLCGDLRNPYVPIAILLIAALGALGACDDLVKLRTAARGLRARTKFAAQLLIALVVATLSYRAGAQADEAVVFLPLLGKVSSAAWLIVGLSTATIVVASNAVNLADGLDGLAGGCLLCASGAMALVVYAGGHAEWASYLQIPHVIGGSEMAVVAAGMIGGLMGFLWFNCHPASVFMGDTGSLPLGGLLGLLAVIARQEALLLLIGGVFALETASVILQVACYRLTGKRIFLCAPLHHHFQLKGWPEDKIVVRFWIAGVLCALFGLGGLKLGARDHVDQPQMAKHQTLTNPSAGVPR